MDLINFPAPMAKALLKGLEHNYERPTIAICLGDDPANCHVLVHKKGNQYVEVTDTDWQRKIHNYHLLSESGRCDKINACLRKKGAHFIDVPDLLPCYKFGDDVSNCSGATSILKATHLWENLETGYSVIGNCLCGLHASALHEAEPSLVTVLSVNCAGNLAIREPLEATICTFANKTKITKKSFRVNRSPVLRFEDEAQCIRDFATLKFKCKWVKKETGLHFRLPEIPFPYDDTVAIIENASSGQLKKALPYLHNAGIVLLDCHKLDAWGAQTMKTVCFERYDPDILEMLRNPNNGIAGLMRCWWSNWGDHVDELNWACDIVAKARASFTPPGDHYINACIKPDLLSTRVRYFVWLDFLGFLVEEHLATEEMVSPAREDLDRLFGPHSAKKNVVTGSLSDVKVMIEVTRAIVRENESKVRSESEKFQRGKDLAAWRMIGGQKYLIFLESDWIKALRTYVKTHPEIDASILNTADSVENTLGKIRKDNAVGHKPKSGNRDRYDLLRNGTGDSTYVATFRADIIERGIQI